MRIGVDACCWSNRRGYGRFTRELINALVAIDNINEYLFFVDEDTAEVNEFPEGVKIIIVPTTIAPTKAASYSGRRSIRDLCSQSLKVRKHDLDLFYFPTNYLYYPILNRTKVVVTIHDATANNHPSLIFPSKKLNFFWKMKQRLAIWQAHLIITVSEYSKSQIMKHFKIHESRIRVINEAAASQFSVLPRVDEINRVLSSYKLDQGERFLLYVGGISPHKNLRTLITAYHELLTNPKFSDLRLVLAGDYENDIFYSCYESLKMYIDELQLQKKTVFTGYIGDRDLSYLYNAASILVLPSFDEGFGLPAVEAMSCGTPVVSSNHGSLSEVVGDAGLFFHPYQYESLLRVLKMVLSNDSVRNKMKVNGLKRAKNFSWPEAAKKTLSIFNELTEKQRVNE